MFEGIIGATVSPFVRFYSHILDVPVSTLPISGSYRLVLDVIL